MKPLSKRLSTSPQMQWSLATCLSCHEPRSQANWSWTCLQTSLVPVLLWPAPAPPATAPSLFKDYWSFSRVNHAQIPSVKAMSEAIAAPGVTSLASTNWIQDRFAKLWATSPAFSQTWSVLPQSLACLFELYNHLESFLASPAAPPVSSCSWFYHLWRLATVS